jgi:tetratricopeptide (TPR) repeat protein
MNVAARSAAMHGALWSIDRSYRLWWYIWPISVASLICGWIYLEKPANTTTSSPARRGESAPAAPLRSAAGPADLSLWPEKLREDVRACTTGILNSNPAIEACSRLIGSRQLTERQLVATYAQRGLYYATTQPDRALADFDAALRIRPDTPEVLINRGWTYLNRRQFDAAVADLNKAIELFAPESAALARLFRANAFFRLKNYAKAIPDLDESQKIDPDNPDLYLLRGRVENAQQRYEAALRDYDEYIRRAPRDLDGLMERGKVLEATLRWHEALLTYNKVLKLDPTNDRAITARDGLLLTQIPGGR